MNTLPKLNGFPSAADYLDQCTITKCNHCGTALFPAKLEHYTHAFGWPLHGFDEKQWLYVVCPKCKYQWALWKLGVPRA